MNMPTLLIAFFAACGAGILLSLVVRPGRQGLVLAGLGCLAAVVAVAAGIEGLLTGAVFTQPLWSLPGLTTLTLRLDPLSAAFILVTGLVLFPASIYAGGELRRESAPRHKRAFTVMLLALYASIVLILIAGDALLFLLAWEVMSILCYLLVVSAPGGENGQVGSAYLMLAMGEAGTLAAAVTRRELAAIRRPQIWRIGSGRERPRGGVSPHVLRVWCESRPGPREFLAAARLHRRAARVCARTRRGDAEPRSVRHPAC
jgi:formate hydrogenlyase subunit 3/multisubunit Na+/H+ antiporter MnhD subunit